MSQTHQRTRGRPRAFTPNPEQTTIQALDRALIILKALAENEGLSLTEVAEMTGQAPATVYRVLSTFQGHAILELDAPTQLWFIGSEAFRIGSAFLSRTSLVERARPILRELMMETGETANLAIADEGKVVFVSQVETHEPIRAFFRPGTRTAMHASGIGKAMLAHCSPERRKALTGLALQSFTAKTHTDPASLIADLDEIQTRRWAVDDEEHAAGMRCIAAAVFNDYGEPIGGLSISGPAARIGQDRDALLGMIVRNAAERLTDEIGGSQP